MKMSTKTRYISFYNTHPHPKRGVEALSIKHLYPKRGIIDQHLYPKRGILDKYTNNTQKEV